MLLISDTNIIMDMQAGALLETLFSLPYDIAMVDVVLDTELRHEAATLRALGLQTVAAIEDDFSQAITLHNHHPPGFYDCLTLVTAKRGQHPLLTGDKALRELARQQSLEVYGTIWIFEQMLKAGTLDCQTAQAAMMTMESRGRRLPWRVLKEAILQLCTEGDHESRF